MFLFIQGVFRLVAFWAIAVAALGLAAAFFSWLDPWRVYQVVRDAVRFGDIGPVSSPDFAFALAGSIFFLGCGMAVAFGICHVLPVAVHLRIARGQLIRHARSGSSRGDMRRSFAAGFEDIRQRLERNRLIGHAWAEFEETLYDTDSDKAIGNTVRPQAFFNVALARERLGGLKLMNAVPGYFVGIGLLLTFIGLVLALYKAGSAATAGSAEQMVEEMGSLLQIATFKFSTSIAGLGISIFLSVVFRLYTIWIEGLFDRFNAVLERCLLYAAPQTISLEMKRTLQDQLTQLKDITQGQFFTRMGEEIAPRLNTAISEAMRPVSEQIGSAVGSLTESSRDGVQDLLQRFSDSVSHGAGAELRELAASLKQLQMSMVEAQGGLRGSGEEFARKLSEAADNLNRMVERAGESFEKSSGESRDALAGVVEALRQTLEKANSEMDQALGDAAKGASDKLEAAMGVVLGKLEQQIAQLGAHSEQTRAGLEASVSRSSEMQQAVLAGLESTVESISSKLRGAIETATVMVDERFRDLGLSMRSVEDALRNQKVALEGASAEAGKTAEAFGHSAQSVRTATEPLITVGTQFSKATEALEESVAETLEVMSTTQEQISALAAGLSQTNEATGAFWNAFAAKFDDVDTALGRSVSVLSKSTLEQQELLERHVQGVDTALASAVDKLAAALGQIDQSAEAIAEALEGWKQAPNR
jgi:hypothetical protein